eukprot:COSAG01_NODE_59988_length_297_cov_0.656566_1_plen_89_part_10
MVRVRVYSPRLDRHVLVAADQQQRLLLVQPIHGMNDAGGVRTVVCHCPCRPEYMYGYDCTEILTHQSADFSADQTEIQCQFRSASSMQP